MNTLLIALTMYFGGIGLPIGRMINSPIIQEKLNLTDSQIYKLRNVWYPAEETLIDLRAKRNKVRLQIREELTKKDVNFNRLQKLFNDLSEVNAKIGLVKAKMAVSVRKILTKDQLMKLRKMRVNRFKRLLMAERKARRFRGKTPALPPVNR